MDDGRRVLVTGIGVLSGPAAGVDSFWTALLADEPERPTARGLVGFEPRAWLDRRLAQRADPFAQVAVAAGRLALDDADLATVPTHRTGVVMGVALGPLSSILAEHQRFVDGGTRAVSALMPVRTLPNANAAVLGAVLGIDGPCWSVAAGCASGGLAVGEGARLVARGDCDVALVGASEAGMDAEVDALEFLEAGLDHLRVITDEPVGRPFDVERRGFVPAEGAAVLVLESEEHVRSRGARAYAEVLGLGTALDVDLVAPSVQGGAIANAVQRALGAAGVAPEVVGHVNAHGSGTPTNDVAEAAAVHLVFGAPGPPVTSVKGTTGHSGAAAGAIEAATLALSVHHALVPAVHGLRTVDPALGLDVVHGGPRSWEPGVGVSLSLGLGGHVACVAMGPA